MTRNSAAETAIGALVVATAVGFVLYAGQVAGRGAAEAPGPKGVKAAIAEVRRFRRTLRTGRIDLRAPIAEGRR